MRLMYVYIGVDINECVYVCLLLAEKERKKELEIKKAELDALAASGSGNLCYLRINCCDLN
jgi:hypothetical protein